MRYHPMYKKRNKPIEHMAQEIPSRRKFLSRIWSILGLVALAELAFFTISMLRPGRKISQGQSCHQH